MSNASDGRNRSRRRFMAAGVVLAGAAVSRMRHAHAAEKVSETDPQAKALNYHLDAAKVQSSQRKQNAFCHNCQFYSGKSGEKFGPCAIFGGKLVDRTGWCSAWVQKS